MNKHLTAILRSYPEIFFLRGGLLGLVFLAVTLTNPTVAIAGLLAVLAAYGFAQFVGMKQQFLESGFYTYNPLLVGLSLGCLFRLTPLTGFFVASAGIITFMLTVLMADVLARYLGLPILSLPFVVVSSVAYLASLRYSNLLVATPHVSAILASDFGLPLWITGFLRSLGAVLFAPSVAVGALIALALLGFSRILFMLSVLGYYAGTALRAAMLGSVSQALADTTAFNFILIAMAVGGVFLIPSCRSYLIAVISVCIATYVLDATTVFWSYYEIPVFALPFNLTSLGVIYVLGIARHPMVAKRVGRTPEETLECYLSDVLRYPGDYRTLYLPFAGEWTVWQGFDGCWTHKGSWRHAYDFLIADEQGRTHQGEGNRVEDYYCYRKPVLSPIRGTVVEVVDHLPDNTVGSVDKTNNWGNFVILQDLRGFYVAVSHLAPRSLRVKRGDPVERGQTLALCGNSGYSPQPHIQPHTRAGFPHTSA